MEFTRDELVNLALTVRRVTPQNFEEAQVMVRLEEKLAAAIKAADEQQLASLVNSEINKRATANTPPPILP